MKQNIISYGRALYKHFMLRNVNAFRKNRYKRTPLPPSVVWYATFVAFW